MSEQVPREHGQGDDAVEAQQEEDVYVEDENLNEVVDAKDMCRVCESSIDTDSRKMMKTSKSLPAAFSKLYGIDIKAEDSSMPTYLHQKCYMKIDRAYQKSKKNVAVPDLPKIKKFVTRMRKCTGCNQYNTGHNRGSCPEVSSSNSRRKKKKPLMELSKRENGNVRCKEWFEYTEKFCEDKHEDLQDLLAFNLRRVLIVGGDRLKADLFDRLMKNEKTSLDPFSPRTTFARQIVSRRSNNQFKDDFKFGRQHKKQVLATPEKVDLERFRISQKNVSFKLISHEGDSYQYCAPTLPAKPNVQQGWKELHVEERKQQWNLYRNSLKEYKNQLRPDRIRPPSCLPESIRPDFIAVGNSYPNILAFSLYDIREDILENLSDHPEVELEDGVLKVAILGSDGCDGAAGYHLMSKPTEREIPDHALAYDFGITEVSTQLKGEKLVLYDSVAVSVFNLQPKLRAACNENDHFATHSLTVPIETARSLLCQSSIEVRISEDILLKSESIEIITSKIDKKYADEQGGLGEGNYPCNLCTASKEEIRSLKHIKEGFKLNRTYAQGVEAAEQKNQCG